jgi:hypothetical protein
MWRFVLPAFLITGTALIVLSAGLTDLPSLPNALNRLVSMFSGAEPQASSPSSLPAGVAQKQSDRETQEPQSALSDPQTADVLQKAADVLQQAGRALQEQDPQPSQTADPARSSSLGDDVEQQQQRQVEETALARQKQMAAATLPRAASSRSASPPAPPKRASASRYTAPVPPPEQSRSARQRLVTAQQWLVMGRPDEARRELVMAQTQMVLQPVTPEQPTAEGGNPSATDVGKVIRWLDMGANRVAVEALNQVIANGSQYPPD